MAVTHNELQVLWATAAFLSVTTGAVTGTSDALALNTAAVDGMITCKADNAGTPAAGDTVDFYALYSTGDPDGSGTAEYDTGTQGTYLCTVDTFAVDPAIRTVRLPIAATNVKIHAVNNGASNVTVSCGVVEVRA